MIEYRDRDIAVEQIQRTSLDVLEGAIPKGPVALLDFPAHLNTGDTLIWLGELRYLRELDLEVRYSSDFPRFDRAVLERRHPTGPLLLHGGGNFGDVWPEYQAFREHVVSEFQDRTIVQLPQSVRFSSKEAASRANRILGSHPDFLLLVRDLRSLERAKELLPDVRSEFCPDMAFGWEVPQIKTKRNSGAEPLVLARGDHEAQFDLRTAVRDSGLNSFHSTDWRLGLRGRLEYLGIRAVGKTVKEFAGVRRNLYPLHAAINSRLTDLNIASAVELFADRPFVVTDRLHAHVLAGLLKIPHVVVDNNYGKTSAIYEAYSGSFVNSILVTDAQLLPAAIGQLQSLERV